MTYVLRFSFRQLYPLQIIYGTHMLGFFLRGKRHSGSVGKESSAISDSATVSHSLLIDDGVAPPVYYVFDLDVVKLIIQGCSNMTGTICV